MVPALLYLLFKKLRKQDWKRIKRSLISKIFIRSNQVILVMVVLLLLISFILAAQKQTLNYKVIRKGSEIGWLSLDKLIIGTHFTISMSSEVSVRFLFTFSSVAKEVSEFKDGKLLHSYFYRKTNGRVKANRHTRLVDNNYEVEEKTEKKKLNILPVAYNTLCMYFQKPSDDLNKVYSDNYQCFVDIERQSDNGYKVRFPDGDTNTFYYINGICCKVKVDHGFYSAAIVLK